MEMRAGQCAMCGVMGGPNEGFLHRALVGRCHHPGIDEFSANFCSFSFIVRGAVIEPNYDRACSRWIRKSWR